MGFIIMMAIYNKRTHSKQFMNNGHQSAAGQPGESANAPMGGERGRRETSGPYIDCQDLFKIYKRSDLEVVALRGVDLEVQAGEVVAIIGASGSGKSTLLNILAGLDRPSAGQVRVGSRDLLNISDRELVSYRRLEVGFVWQATSRNLVPYLTVRDNVELPMTVAGTKSANRRSQAMELLSALGLADKTNRLPHQLSGGEQQRVALGVALANRPPLILADEPTGELDTESAVQVFRLFQELRSLYGVTVVIVTHYPGVARFVDRVVHIRDGRISSESFARPSHHGSGEILEDEFVVIDRAGRLQLPKEYADQFQDGGLAKVDLEGDTITIRPPETNKPPVPSKPPGEQDAG